MFQIQFKLSANKTKANQFMEDHNAWLKDGFTKGTFFLAEAIQPKLGGAILAHNATREEVQATVKEDPLRC